MKREPIKSILENYVYRSIKTLFTWNLCEICDKEFRREWGWKITRIESSCCPPYLYDPEYICKECIPNESALIQYLKAEEERLRKPPKF